MDAASFRCSSASANAVTSLQEAEPLTRGRMQCYHLSWPSVQAPAQQMPHGHCRKWHAECAVKDCMNTLDDITCEVMGWAVRAGARPEGCQHGRAAREVLPVEAGYGQAEGALGGDAVAQRVAAVAPVRDADRVRAQAPDGRLERIAARSPLVAKLIACLQCTWKLGTLQYQTVSALLMHRDAPLQRQHLMLP